MWRQSFKIGSIEIKNRILRSATAERVGDKEGRPSPELKDIYGELARGGTGLIITGFTYIHPSGRTSIDQSGIYSDDLIPSWKEIVRGIKRVDPTCMLIMQIVHGGRQVSTECVKDPISPSPVHDSSTGITPREMTEEEIVHIIECFGEAARRAAEAGFDGVEIHGAHGFLVSQFLSPYTNRRNDRWGGSPENRRRFLLEIIRAIRKRTGEDFPVLLKMNGCDFIDGGLEIEEAREIAISAFQEGIDAIEVSGGIYESRERGAARKHIVREESEGYFVYLASAIKQAVDIPVITVGGFRSLRVIDSVLLDKKADAVSLSRPLIREPDLIKKFSNGKERADCISCNKCLSIRSGRTRCRQIAD